MWPDRRQERERLGSGALATAVLCVWIAAPGHGCSGSGGQQPPQAPPGICSAGPSPPAPFPVPSFLEGANRRVWTRAGDPIRLVCREPCPIAESGVLALYSGMLAAREALVAAAGVDVLPGVAPVDAHLAADDSCSSHFPSVAGYTYLGADGRGVLCLFTWEWSDPPPPWLACPIDADAGRVSRQGLFIHEYGHLLFFGRHEFSHEQLVTGLAMHVSGSVPGACDTENGQTSLVYQLCIQAGFEWSDLAPTMLALEAIYQAGQGEAPLFMAPTGTLPPTSTGQLRAALDARLGRPTLRAFLVAGSPPYPFLRRGATLPASGGTAEFYPAFDLSPPVLLSAAPGAVGADLVIPSAPVYLLPASFPADWWSAAWSSGLDLGVSGDFAAPVQLTLRYDPSSLPAGTPKGKVWMWGGYGDGNLAPLPAAAVDAAAHTVTAPIPRLGTFVVGPPPG